MLATYDMLKTDPFRSLKGDKFYIKKDDFYDDKNGVYVKPSASLLSKVEEANEEGNNKYRLFRINGYAGCGKTLFAHYIMYKYGYDNCFYYEFDQGEGNDYSLSYVLQRMISQFANHIVNTLKDNFSVLTFFKEYGVEIFGDDTLHRMISNLFFDSKWLFENEKFFTEEKRATVLATIVTSLRENSVSSKNDVNDSIKFLLICDYLWRRAEFTAGLYGSDKKTIFCLLDNIDNLQRDAVVDLYINIYDVISKLKDLRIANKNSEDSAFDYINYIYIFPTREVTTQLLLDGLRRKRKEDLFSQLNTIFPFIMEKSVTLTSRIIRKRKEYWSNHSDLEDAIKEIDYIEKIMDIPFVQGQFSSLLNGNYTHCIDRILDLYKEMPDLLEECYSLQYNECSDEDYLGCSKTGASGTLLRLILELFKERNVFNSVTDPNAENEFNVNGKLALGELNLELTKNIYNISLSRLILTFIYETPNKRVRINQLFRCFEHEDGREICRIIYALSENLRDIWRRLIVFSSNIPNSLEDIYKQYEKYSQNPLLNSSEFTEVELCLSGSTYIRMVIPNFEFYLMRINKNKNVNQYPPLFTKMSISTYTNNKLKCLNSIDKVLSSVEKCANEIYKFDCYIIKKCIEDKNTEYILRFFTSSKEHGSKQSYLSRIIFSHISYVEKFRRYILHKLLIDENNVFTKQIININKQIISYIIRYLALFNNEPLKNEYQILLNNEFLPEGYKDSIINTKTHNDKKTCNDIVKVSKKLLNNEKNKNIHNVIETGYMEQEKALINLFSMIQNIHNSKYQIISKIEQKERKH